MAISVGTYTEVRNSSTVGVSGAQSETYNMPSAGSDRGLVIIITTHANGAPNTVSGVSYGSSGTLTEVVTNQYSRTRTYIYCVENPDTGNNTLAWTMDSSTNRSHSVHAIPLTGVHQTDMSGVSDTLDVNVSSTMNKSVTTGTDNSELVGIAECNYDGTSMNPFSESASNTMLAESNTGTSTNFDHEWWVGHRSTTTAGAYTFGGTANSTSSGSLVVVEVLEAAAAGGIPAAVAAYHQRHHNRAL